MGVERVSVDSNFFDDLGADSMVMSAAHGSEAADLPSVSIKDIYQHPTVRSLATALTDAGPVLVESPAQTSVRCMKRGNTARRAHGAAA